MERKIRARNWAYIYIYMHTAANWHRKSFIARRWGRKGNGKRGI